MTLPNTNGSVQTTVFTGMPRVNLMPQELAEASKFRRLQYALGASLLVSVGIVGALTYQAQHGVHTAKSQLAAAQAEQTRLQSQRAGLQTVQDVYAQVAAKQAMLQQAMGGEIRWSYYLEDLSLRIPSNVWLTNVAATESGTGPGAGGAAATGGVGSITFGGVAFSHDDVATWLDVLAKEKGYSSPYFSNSTETFIGPRKVVNFSSSVVLTNDAKSGRYTSASGS